MAVRIAAGQVTKTRRWRMSAAGQFAIIDPASGAEVTPRSRKARAILAFLCSQPGQRFTRERIASLLWGDRGEAQARASLRQALLEIRQAVSRGPQLLGSDRAHLWAEPSSLEPDALDETSWAHSDKLPFEDLQNVSPDFDDWLVIARAERMRVLGQALRAEVESLLERNRGAAALPLIERMRRMDPFDEEVLRLGLMAEYQAGRPAAMQRRINEMDALLKAELGVAVSTQSRAMHAELMQALVAPVPKQSEGEETASPEAANRQLPLAARRPWPVLVAIMLLAGTIGVAKLGPAALAAPKPIAVLPFEASESADADTADGLSQELLSQLTQDKGLRVIGRTSAWQYKGKAVDLRAVGRQLGVDYVVEGTVARRGDRTRVAVSLVRARDGSAIWSRIYEASDAHAPFIRGAIGSGIAAALGLPRQALLAGYEPDGQAYALYLRARGLFRQRTQHSMEVARGLLLEAIRIDPNFAPAWAYAGGISNLLGEDRFPLDPMKPDGLSMTPRQALERALQLDPNLAEAHGFMGWIGGRWSAEGERHFARAVQLEPNNPQILFWYAEALLRNGHYARYAQVAHRAAALDPLWQRSVEAAASASLWAGDEAQVRRYLARIREGNPEGAIEVESSIATQRGDFSKTIELALSGNNRSFQVSISQAATNLMDLGFEREALMLDRSAVQRFYSTREAPDQAQLLKLARDDPDFDYGAALWNLRSHGRYADIVALYDAGHGDMAEMRRATDANRGLRSALAGAVGQAMLKTGRRSEGMRLLRLAADADRAMSSTGPIFDCYTVVSAANQAAAGNRERAIAILQKAFSRFDCLSLTVAGKLDPMFENLRGDPRFEAILRRHVAHLRKERREVEALGLV